ncbi:MAG: ATP-binding cassette domain-containing protein [Bacteroidetes bacterium]|nr:ATP-binding cassette domain-containing protein [Bacteroidota bacterium]
MSVRVEGLTKLYGKQKAIDNLSFSIDGAGVVGLLGPNGAGKSTTMKILSGYLRQDTGQALVMGLEVTQNLLDIKKRVGYLPEHNPLYTDMYVQEYLTYVCRIYRVAQPQKRVNQLLEMTGLHPEQHKKIGQLSRGYRQRVGLAQALAPDPPVLILDEPTSGLDPNQLTEIRALIRETGRDKTILLSTHIMQEVETLCTHVLMLARGRLVADSDFPSLRAAHPGSSLEDIFRTLTRPS